MDTIILTPIEIEFNTAKQYLSNIRTKKLVWHKLSNWGIWRKTS